MNHATLGPVASHRAMQADPALRAEKFAELSGMDYADLSDLADSLSVEGDWSLLDDVRHEQHLRKAEAMGALSRLFCDAVKTIGTIPWVDFTGAGKKLGKRDIAWWLREWAGTNESTDKLVDLVLDPDKRARLIGSLSANYASEQVEELLCAGWGE